MTHRGSRVLHVGSLSRVEGEGSLYLRIRGEEVSEARLAIYEPPRFFEAFLRGRSYTEPPDITSRICGICPVAYQLSACRAIEDACGVTVDGQLAALRRLIYCGEWIESHTLHVHLLHAPDFHGCANVVELARSRRADVERGLRLKQAGNAIIELLGGRAVHPVNVRLGGFHRVPSRSELRPLEEQLRRAREDAALTVRWVAGFDFPEAGCDHDLLALAEPDRYAIESGTPTVMPAPHTAGLPATSRMSTAHPHLRRPRVRRPRRRAPGPALHRPARPARRPPPPDRPARPVRDQRTPAVPDRPPGRPGRRSRRPPAGCRLPQPLPQHRRPGGRGAARRRRGAAPHRRLRTPATPVRRGAATRSKTGHGATEAPRGLLHHRYTLDAEGTVTDAVLVPPTAQNQDAIEEDLRRTVQEHLRSGDPTDAELTALCERAVRNHDPCISCSTHFLDLTVDRAGGGH